MVRPAGAAATARAPGLPDGLGARGVALGVRLRAQRDHVGQLGDGLEVAELGETRETERVEPVAGQQRQVGVSARTTRPVAVVLQVALADRLDEQRVLVRAAGARAPGGDAAARSAPSAPARSATARAEQPALGAQLGRERVEQRAHATSANAAAAASTRARDVLGRVGERREPGLELRRRRVDAAGEQRAAPGAVGLGSQARGARVVARAAPRRRRRSAGRWWR